MFHYYFAEQQMALREQELRSAARRPRVPAGTPSTRRGAAGVARVLRSVADRLDSR